MKKKKLRRLLRDSRAECRALRARNEQLVEKIGWIEFKEVAEKCTYAQPPGEHYYPSLELEE
jgi:hypothetical protein